jgi:hypothetical protein
VSVGLRRHATTLFFGSLAESDEHSCVGLVKVSADAKCAQVTGHLDEGHPVKGGDRVSVVWGLTWAFGAVARTLPGLGNIVTKRDSAAGMLRCPVYAVTMMLGRADRRLPCPPSPAKGTTRSAASHGIETSPGCSTRAA